MNANYPSLVSRRHARSGPLHSASLSHQAHAVERIAPAAAWLRFVPLALAVVLCGFVPLLRAAPAASQQAVALRFLFLDESSGGYWLKTGATYQELGDVPYFVGTAVTVSPGERLELLKEMPDSAGKDAKLRRVKVASVIPPAGVSGALVVVSPPVTVDPKAGPVAQLAYFDNSPEVFPARSIRVVNLAQAPVAARFSSSQVLTGPGAVEIIRPEPDARNRVRTKAAIQTSAGWQLLYDSLTIVRPRQRVTALCVYSPNGMKQAYDPEELAQIGNPPPGHFWLTYTDVL